MPRYEYRCDLGHLHEEERTIHEEQRIVRCPECDRLLKRVWNPAGIQFKGRGFYSTGG